MKTLIQILILTLITIPLSQAQSYDELIKQGEDKFAAGDYKTSKEFFKKAVDLNPNGVVGIYSLGYLMGATGEADAGMKYLDKAIAMAPDSTQFILGRSEIKGYVMGDTEGAIKDMLLYKDHKSTKTPEAAYAHLVQFYVDSGDYTNAEIYIKKTEQEVKELPNSFYYNKARFQSAKKQYAQAIQSATKAINMYPDWPMPYFTRAKALYEVGKYDKSISDYNTYIKGVPNDDIAYSNRALGKEMSGDLSGAMSDYSKAIELYDKDAVTYLNRSTLYKKMNKLDNAISDLNKAEALNPNISTIFSNRGNYYAEQKNYTKAIADFTKAIKLAPKNQKNYSSRSLAYLKVEKYNEAYADALKVLELSPNDNNGYLNGATALFNMNKFSEAKKLASKGIEKNPNDGMLYYLRSAINKELGNTAEAASDDSKAKSLLSK